MDTVSAAAGGRIAHSRSTGHSPVAASPESPAANDRREAFPLPLFGTPTGHLPAPAARRRPSRHSRYSQARATGPPHRGAPGPRCRHFLTGKGRGGRCPPRLATRHPLPHAILGRAAAVGALVTARRPPRLPPQSPPSPQPDRRRGGWRAGRPKMRDDDVWGAVGARGGACGATLFPRRAIATGGGEQTCVHGGWDRLDGRPSIARAGCRVHFLTAAAHTSTLKSLDRGTACFPDNGHNMKSWRRPRFGWKISVDTAPPWRTPCACVPGGASAHLLTVEQIQDQGDRKVYVLDSGARDASWQHRHIMCVSHRVPNAAPSRAHDWHRASYERCDRPSMGVIAGASHGGLRRGCATGTPRPKGRQRISQMRKTGSS